MKKNNHVHTTKGIKVLYPKSKFSEEEAKENIKLIRMIPQMYKGLYDTYSTLSFALHLIADDETYYDDDEVRHIRAKHKEIRELLIKINDNKNSKHNKLYPKK